MADDKDLYSEAAKYYVEETVPNNEVDRQRYERSKAREAEYNDNWIKQKVNLNEIVDRFDANTQNPYYDTVKFVFEGERYKVKADMVAGYLRIYDKSIKKYVKLDGTAGNRNDDTHFKIMRREEM